MSDGEFAFINWLRRQVKPSESVPVGIGDDAAVVVAGGERILLTVDEVVEGVHFEPRKASPEQIGWKALARSLSDIAAMGGVADYALASAALSERYGQDEVRRIWRGMASLAREVSVELVGGDTSSGAKSLVLSVTSVGHMPEGKDAVLRSGAKEGDAIMATGEFGGSLLGKHLSFRPRLEEAARLMKLCGPSAMIDVSDGLAQDLGHILEGSGVGALLYEEAIPISADAVSMAESSGSTPLEHALSDGEDYELLFTLGLKEAERLMREWGLGVRLSRVGEVTKAGLRMKLKSGEVVPVEAKGYEHRVE